MARASTVTLLSLDRYAKIMGISPPHFNSGQASTVFPAIGGCSDIWWQYAWQKHDRISREDLACAIYDAEQEIARQLGYYPAPTWIAQETHRFPQYHRRDLQRATGLNVRGQRISLTTRFGKFIQAGQRAVTLVGTATTGGGTLVYDLAAQTMTATITLATALTDECEIKTYFNGHSGAREWEIRPERSKSISGGSITIVFDAWLLLDPGLWEAYPTTKDGPDAIDITDVSNYVTSVDVYQEYTDFTATSATFYWEPKPQSFLIGSVCTSCGGTGCVACALTSQNGCIHVRDVNRGIVVPQPATYSADDGQWSQDAFSECRDPDLVKIYYYAGDIDNRWLMTETCEPLSDYWSHAIAWLATARLERSFCSCANVQALAQDLRKDLAAVGETSFQLDPEELSNPFGTRKGEIMAWRRVAKNRNRQLAGGAI